MTDSPTALVSIKNVSKYFGAMAAVNDVSLDIYEGEFFALLGPSGCGKSTLLRMLAGFETPDSGTITLGGKIMNDLPPYRRPVNMMFQSYALFPHLTVEQNVAFGLKQERLSRLKIAERVESMLDLLELQLLRARKPHQLSGGQQQRVALGRCLVKQPQLILLDEPLGALDKRLREQMQFELMRIQKQVGITFVMVTHDQEEAMAMANRMAIMHHGEIVQVGCPYDLYEEPKSRFVAEFVGDINIMEGIVVEDQKAGKNLHVPAIKSHLPLANNWQDLPANTTLTWAIRPEKIRLLPMTAPAQENYPVYLEGVVQDIGYLGKMTTVKILLPNDQIFTATIMGKHQENIEELELNHPVRLSWRSDAPIIIKAA